jgi:hypothetical protein
MTRKLIVLAAVLVIGACSREAPTEDIDKAASLFFDRMKAAEYDTIYDDSSDTFKKAKSRAEVVDNLKQLAALGRPQNYSRLSMSYDSLESKRMVHPVYAVLTEQSRADVTLSFVDNSGEWKLVGFAVKPRGGAVPSS